MLYLDICRYTCNSIFTSNMDPNIVADHIVLSPWTAFASIMLHIIICMCVQFYSTASKMQRVRTFQFRHKTSCSDRCTHVKCSVHHVIPSKNVHAKLLSFWLHQEFTTKFRLFCRKVNVGIRGAKFTSLVLLKLSAASHGHDRAIPPSKECHKM